MKMKHFLIPTDFSEVAGFATELAVKMAQQEKGKVHLLNRTHIHPLWEHMTEEEKKSYPESGFWEDVTLRAFEGEKEKHSKYGVELTFSYGSGDLIPLIEDYVDENDVDMIVMGSHGAAGLNEILFGSNAQRTVRNLTVPTLVVKQPVPNPEFKRIVFASDFKEEAIAPFQELVEFARRFGSSLYLINIAAFPKVAQTQEDHRRMDSFASMCKDVPVHKYERQDTTVEAGITHFANHIKADLVAMVHGHHNLMYRLVVGSISEAVVNHLDLPVLIFGIAPEEEPSVEEIPDVQGNWAPG